MKLALNPAGLNPQVKGKIRVPGDKSISHRALMIGSLCTGVSRFSNMLTAEDIQATARLVGMLGVKTNFNDKDLEVHGVGLAKFQEPQGILQVGNSGTTIRLGMGLVSASNIMAVFSGDESLNRRPMDRVIRPLSTLGANFVARAVGTRPPVVLLPSGSMHSADYQGALASAQVKSSLLLAAVQIPGTSSYQEPVPTRDHTERMLQAAGAQIQITERITITGGRGLKPLEMSVPGDFSSAAFWIVAGLIHPNTELYLEDVGINERRIGLLRTLIKMGGRIEVCNRRRWGGEEVADLIVKSSDLVGIEIKPGEIPDMIDEIPILAVAAAQAKGRTRVSGAGELRFKESDRLQAISTQFGKLGVQITPLSDGFEIIGSAPIMGGEILSNLDHRIAMSGLVLASKASKTVLIHGAESINTSYPDFVQDYCSIFGANSIQKLPK